MIIGLERFKGKPKQWKQLNPIIKVQVKFKYPSVELKDHKPKNRLALSRKILQAHYQTLASQYKKCQPRGEKELYGAVLSLPYHQLPLLQKNQTIEYISVLKIKGVKRRKEKKTPRYFSVVLQIIIEVEGVQQKKCLNELRVVLIKASSMEQAKKKVKKGVQADAPYLNPMGRLVHWKLKRIVDCYETPMEDLQEIHGVLGVEVYSKFLKNEKTFQKLIKAMYK